MKVTVRVKNQKTVDDSIAKDMHVIRGSDEDGAYSKMFVQFIAEHAQEQSRNACCEVLLPDYLQQHPFPPMHGIEKSVLMARMKAIPVIEVIGNHDPALMVFNIR